MRDVIVCSMTEDAFRVWTEKLYLFSTSCTNFIVFYYEDSFSHIYIVQQWEGHLIESCNILVGIYAYKVAKICN
jgi:hypothetical protein